MLLILGHTINFGRLAQAVAMGLVVLCGAFLTACADDQDTQAAEGPRPTAAGAVAPANSQPTQEATRPGTVSAGADAAGSSPSNSTVEVVTSTNFVGDWARIVGGDRAEVFALLPPGQDPHSYSPGGRDVARVSDADLVLTVGLSLEANWLYDLLRNASADESRLIALGELVDPIEFSGPDPHGHHGDDHGGMMTDGGHGEPVLGRLLIGDGETGSMSVIDLETGEVSQGQFDLMERAGRIYATKTGRFAVAVSSDADTAHLFDGGVFMQPHGDHFDLVEAPAQKLGIDLAGDRPVHLYVGGEWATIFYDGSGDVVLINEHELEEQGHSYVPVRFNVGPQHGAAVPLEDDLFAISIKDPDYPANPDARRPIGAEIRDLDGSVLYTAEAGCPDLHGDASNGHQAVFGCTGGALMIEAHDGEYGHGFVSAPEGSPEDFRLTSVWGYPGLDHFFALGSAVGLYVVDPEEGEMEQLIPASDELRPIQVALSYDGEALLVVMSDGELRMYEAHDLDLVASASDFLAAPVETGFWARPHVTTAPGAVFVTDSVAGMVHQLDAHDLEMVDHWEVAGTPTKIAFVGIVGGEDGGHDEHSDDEHAHGLLDPHFWFDPVRVKIAVNEIAAQLSTLDPEGASVYYRNATDYGRQLDELHAWIQEQVAMVPPERRLLVTSHDSLSYFAKAYGFEVVGLVIPSLGTELEPSAEHIAELIEVVREHGVPAVFGETTVSERLAQTVARETGAELVKLYSGSMGVEGSGADTYIGMVRANVERIVEALK